MSKGKWMMGMLAVCFLFLFSAPAPACAGDVIELKVSSHFPTQHPVLQEVFIPWGQTIEKRTNGRVKFTWFPDGSLVKAEQTPAAVKGGMVDIVAPLNIWAAEKQFPASYALIHIPFRFDGEPHASQSFYEAFQKMPEVREELKGMKMLGFASSGIANFHMKGFLVKTMADYKGKRIWPATAVGVQCVKIWGGVPTLVKLADIYMSLQRGTLDGVMFPTPPLGDYRLTDMLNNHTICGFALAAQPIAMNQAKWEALPPDIQKVLEDLTLPLSMAVGKKFMEMNEFTIAALKKRGDQVYVLTPEQKKEWRASLQPVYDAQIAAMTDAGMDGKAVMEKYEVIVEKARQNPFDLDPNWKTATK
jgi:TRAP-type C4-dicarboxylate transport system substrate-binding protein